MERRVKVDLEIIHIVLDSFEYVGFVAEEVELMFHGPFNNVLHNGDGTVLA